MGLNTAVFEFGSLQAYGMCLFMIVAAYTLTVSAVDRPGLLRPALAGLCAGLAADSSLLSAPITPILLIWMTIVNRAGSRGAKFLSYGLGVLIAFVPLIRLLIQSPDHVIFGFLQYQLLYRKVEWDQAGLHNLGEVLTFGDSTQALLLVLLAAAGILLVRQNPSVDRLASRLKTELYLAGSIAFIEGCYLLTARPTFTRYYLLTVPFLSVAAVAGLCEVTKRLTARPRPWLAATILCLLTAYGLAASLFEQRDDLIWSDIEKTVAKVKEVTPPNGTLLADEVVYFALHREPPTGMELEDSHKLRFNDADSMKLHIVPRPKLDLMIKAGRFDTVEMCDDDEITRIGLAKLYSKNETAGTCQVFWKWGPPSE